MGQRLDRHQPVDQRVVEAVDFEGEEQQLARQRCELFLYVAIKFGAGRVGRVLAIDQSGIGHDAAEQVFQRFIGAHGPGQRSCTAIADARADSRPP